MGLEWTARRWCREQRGLFSSSWFGGQTTIIIIKVVYLFGSSLCLALEPPKSFILGPFNSHKKKFLRMFSENFWREILFCSWEQNRRVQGDRDFTRNEHQTRATLEAFQTLFDKGLIVHWSCALGTAISDIEVDKVDVDGPTMFTVPGYSNPVKFGELTHFAYVFQDNGELNVCLLGE